MTQDKDVELKPCPFCGGSKLEGVISFFEGRRIRCKTCYAEGPTAPETRSIKLTKHGIRNKWNTRPAPAVDVEGLKKTVGVYELSPEHPRYRNERYWQEGWNDCIDHLTAQGYLRQPEGVVTTAEAFKTAIELCGLIEKQGWSETTESNYELIEDCIQMFGFESVKGLKKYLLNAGHLDQPEKPKGGLHSIGAQADRELSALASVIKKNIAADCVSKSGENSTQTDLSAKTGTQPTDVQAALEALEEITAYLGSDDAYWPQGEMEKVHKLVEAIRAALEAQQWQPIETAPENELVLLYCPETGCVSNKERVELDYASQGWRNEVANNMSYHSWATHWMPLPKPPQTAQEDGE